MLNEGSKLRVVILSGAKDPYPRCIGRVCELESKPLQAEATLSLG